MFDDLLILIGRFHPLIIHLPIGFIVLGILIELNSKKLKYFSIFPGDNFFQKWLLCPNSHFEGMKKFFGKNAFRDYSNEKTH